VRDAIIPPVAPPSGGYAMHACHSSSHLSSMLERTRTLAAVFALAASTAATAGDFNEPPAPPLGTNTVATADLYVKRPATDPCVVSLFDKLDFIGFSPFPFQYTPPADCPGPWAKIVLQADYNVTAGRQFDRTAVIDVGGVNVYFGTTMEPGATTPRAWHVERDVTDIAATLAGPQSGEAILYNVIDGTYTGHIIGSASLAFYPPGEGVPAAKTAQSVIPMAPTLTALSPDNPVLSKSVTLPMNTERLYLDVIAESQSNDEFWYTCVPDAYAAVLQSCGGGPFREVEVAIDGTPAGMAPVFPWIYSGGISPYMWFPTPGVQTLNFPPSRVDLTPFAGDLDDGAPHTISLSVFDAQDNFSVTATLLAYGDPHAKVVTGGLTQNTLKLPVVNVNTSGLVVKGNHAQGRIAVSSARDFTIAGTVHTSHGKVTTSVATHMDFVNVQHFHVTAQKYAQVIDQRTDVKTLTTVTDAHGTSTRNLVSHYPLTVGLDEFVSGTDIVLDTSATQQRQDVLKGRNADGQTWVRAYSDVVTPQARTLIDENTGISRDENMQTTQHLFVKATGDGCYDRTIIVVANAVTGVHDRCTK
jgi:hypothetical protein